MAIHAEIFGRICFQNLEIQLKSSLPSAKPSPGQPSAPQLQQWPRRLADVAGLVAVRAAPGFNGLHSLPRDPHKGGRPQPAWKVKGWIDGFFSNQETPGRPPKFWISSWWFFPNPFEKYAQVKMGSSSPKRYENNKYFKPPPRSYFEEQWVVSVNKPFNNPGE